MDQQCLCFQFSPELAIEKNAGPVFHPIRKNAGIISEKDPLKKLKVQASVSGQAEIKTKRVVEGILPDQPIYRSGSRDIKLSSICINQFTFEHNRTEIFGNRCANLIDLIVARLENKRLGRSADPVEGGGGIQAVIVKS